MRLLVVGAGGTGGYFGGRLAAAGRDVTFLVRERRAAELKANGLSVLSPVGNISLAAKTVTAGALTPDYDAIVLSTKAYSLDGALSDIAPAMGPDTVIVPLLNGMKHMDTIAAAYGKARLMGGLCSIAVSLDEEGRIVHMSPFHDIVYGELDGSRSARLEQLDADMQGAGFDARASDHIRQEMWEKWTMLSTLAGVTCLMRGSIGDIAAAEGGQDFVLRFLDEAAAVAAAGGHAPGEAYIAKTKALLTAKGSPLTSSMFRDLQGNKPVEALEIIGDLLARARAAKLDTPLLAAANTHLSVYQHR